jgi:hypothetical protein
MLHFSVNHITYLLTHSLHSAESNRGRTDRSRPCIDCSHWQGAPWDSFIMEVITSSMGQSPFWEANSHSASQEIPLFLWHPKVHYRDYKGSPLVPILYQVNPFNTVPFYFSSLILTPFSHLRQVLPRGIFPSGFPTKSSYYISHPCYMTRLYHPPRFDYLINI